MGTIVDTFKYNFLLTILKLKKMHRVQVVSKLARSGLSNVRFSSALSALPPTEDGQGFQSKVVSQDYKSVSHHLLHGYKSDLVIAQEQNTTMDSLPVPEGSYEEHFKKNNARWNMLLAGTSALLGGAFGLCYYRNVFFGNEFPYSEWKNVAIDLNEKPFEIEYAEIELNPVEEKLQEQYIAEIVPWAEAQLAGLDMPADIKEKLIKAFVNDMFVVDTPYA